MSEQLTYWIVGVDEGPNGAQELRLAYWEQKPSGVRAFARAAAENCYNYRDGWEWHWPKEFVILDHGKEVARFSVTMEMCPDFHATRTDKKDDFEFVPHDQRRA